MANKVYSFGQGNEIELVTDALVAIPVDATTTCDTESPTAAGLSQFTTLGELTTGSFTRKTPGSKSLAHDSGNDRGEFTFGAITWTAVTGTLEGVLICKDTGADATMIPIWYIDAGGVSATSGDITMNAPTEGFLQFAPA